MCGMGGIMSTNMIDSEIEYARRIGILNMFRGEDSTGMFDVVPKEKPGEQINYWKSTDHPVDFIKNTFGPLRKTRWLKHTPRLIGIHCRAATQGKLTEANAHPFCFKTLIGMHNGTITKEFANRKKFGTDSEAIFYNIEKMGLADALKEINTLDPAFALIWINWTDNTINFIRNTKRPLAYTYLYGKNTVAWSSEGEHLKIAVTSSTGYGPKLDVTQFKPYIHYSLKLDAKEYTFEEVEVPEAREVVVTKHYGFQGGHTNTYPGLAAWESDTGDEYSQYGLPYNQDKSTQNPAYWEAFGRSDTDTSEIHTAYDVETKKWYTEYAYKELLAARKLQALKLLKSEIKKEGETSANSNVRTFPTKQESAAPTTGSTEKTSKFIADELPWDDNKQGTDGFFDLSVSSEIGKDIPAHDRDGVIIEFKFGPGLTKTCSEAAYLQKTKEGCACCGIGCETDDIIFWLDDKEHICINCAEDLAMHPDNHWLHTQGGMSQQTCERIAQEYFTTVYNEDSPEKQHVSIH